MPVNERIDNDRHEVRTSWERVEGAWGGAGVERAQIRERERERDRQTDRQRQRETERQTDRQTDRQRQKTFCFTSKEARWPIRDGDRGEEGRGAREQSERQRQREFELKTDKELEAESWAQSAVS